MIINIRQNAGITILESKGKITIGAGDVEFRNALYDVLNGGQTKILLNMADVTTMDSSGIGELVSSYTHAANRGGRLKLFNVPAKVQDILMITQLITIFEIFDNEEEAVSSF